MRRHPYFDLWLHEDDELSALVGSQVVQRFTLHEWPLSCVQRVRFADGASYIYKVQTPPTVEPDFYQRARSPLLVAAQALPVTGSLPADGLLPALLLEDVQAPRLDEVYLSESSRLRIVDEVVTQIGQIEGELLAVSDIRTPAQWLAYGEAMIEDLRCLVEAGAFQLVTATQIGRVALQVGSSAVLAAIEGPTGYVYTDLSAENVLVLPDGYRVLDWQRPLWGPVALDRVVLLESLGGDPRRYLPEGLLQLRRLLLIAWFAQAALRWFPPGAPDYDRMIPQLVEQMDSW